jgi:hypothetical protein
MPLFCQFISIQQDMVYMLSTQRPVTSDTERGVLCFDRGLEGCLKSRNKILRVTAKAGWVVPICTTEPMGIGFLKMLFSMTVKTEGIECNRFVTTQKGTVFPLSSIPIHLQLNCVTG